ncbi:MAG: DUF438 domain-containing protein [Eubacteriales bacterium]
MSELINNREYRQKALKELILQLHSGKTVQEVKKNFEELTKGISASEIAEMEQSLISEGMPVEEIQRLCDVHAAVFKGSIEDIHKSEKIVTQGDHPIQIMKEENETIQRIIDERVEANIEAFREIDDIYVLEDLLEDFNDLWELDKHYARKENLLFPYLEKYGITAPPKVMWGVDDEIRKGIKEVKKMMLEYQGEKDELICKIKETIYKITEMIFKEENILFPMAVDSLTESEWENISRESEAFGYTLTNPKGIWKASNDIHYADNTPDYSDDGEISFDAGVLSALETNAIFNTLPLDITFVDKEGKVKYFSQGKERIFARPKTILGREVKNCHPPSSVHVVEQIVEDLKSGKKEYADFWIRMGEKLVYIRYFAVRNKGEYLGVLEITQDIQPIQEITGEKRLMD